jgi:Taurine catabolism dioxygenase TauD, TfdA family
MHFHSDQCYQERPASASMLYAIEVPSRGAAACSGAFVGLLTKTFVADSF